MQGSPLHSIVFRVITSKKSCGKPHCHKGFNVTPFSYTIKTAVFESRETARDTRAVADDTTRTPRTRITTQVGQQPSCHVRTARTTRTRTRTTQAEFVETRPGVIEQSCACALSTWTSAEVWSNTPYSFKTFRKLTPTQNRQHKILIETTSCRICGGVEFLKLINQYILWDTTLASSAKQVYYALESEPGTCNTVRATLWPCPSGLSPWNVWSCCLLARKRKCG
jgi:hypothetical protein